LALGGFLALGIVSLEDKAGCKNRFPVIWAAISERIEVFLAFRPKFLRAEAVTVDGLKIDM
jgi:hypothetical protein